MITRNGKNLMRLTLVLMVMYVFPVAVLSADPSAVDKDEARHLTNIRQVSFGLPRAGEGYFSPDGQTVVFQAYPIGYPFYQIYVQPLDERVPQRISPGRGRTTCAYFRPDGERILFSSAHANPEMEANEAAGAEPPPRGGVAAMSGILTRTWTSSQSSRMARTSSS